MRQEPCVPLGSSLKIVDSGVSLTGFIEPKIAGVKRGEENNWFSHLNSQSFYAYFDLKSDALISET